MNRKLKDPAAISAGLPKAPAHLHQIVRYSKSTNSFKGTFPGPRRICEISLVSPQHLRFPPALAITCWAQLPHPSIRPSALKRSTKAVKEITKRSCEAAKKPREEGYDMDEKRGSNGI